MSTNSIKRLPLKEVQKILYDDLYIVSEIFRKHNLRFVLCGGTMLGAIRHEGMIPWDDDVDLVMWLKDISKIKEVLEAGLPPYLRFVEPSDISPNFFDFVYRIIDTRYTLHDTTPEDNYYKGLTNHIGVDIFLVSGTGNSIFTHKLSIIRQKAIYALSMAHRYPTKESNNKGVWRFIESVCKCIGKIIPQNFLHKLYWSVPKRKASMKHKYYMMVNDIPRNIVNTYETAWILTDSEKKFGEYTYPVVNGYDNILRTKYGDYMTPIKDFSDYNKHYEE